MSITSSSRSTKARTKPADVSPAPELSDADLLRRLWRLTLEGSVKALEAGDANASALNVARQFLSDQGIDHRNLARLEKVVTLDLDALPSFDD